MSNEHLTEVGQSVVDQPVDGNSHDLDEGPLDPSVFFGLFDDLSDEAAAEPAAEPADGAGLFDGPDDAPDDEGATDPDSAAALEPEAPTGDEDREIEPEKIALDDIAPDEIAPPEKIALDDIAPEDITPPDDDPVQRRAEAAADLVDLITVDEPDVEHIDDGDSRPAGVTATAPAVNWWTTGPIPVPAEAPLNGQEATLASPPPIPTQEQRSPAPVISAPSEDATARGHEPGGTMAKFVLATIAVGLIGGLIVAFVLSLRNPDTALDGPPAAPAESTEAVAPDVIDDPAPTGLAGAVAAATPPTGDLLADHLTGALPVALTGRGDFTSLRFEPGTTELDAASSVFVSQLATLLAQQPTVPVTVTVRTYTEATAAANLALSVDQADALATALVAAGAAPDQVRARGLGATPLSPAQPVPNFLALDPSFGDHDIGDLLTDQSRFAYGLPAVPTDDIWPLRLDGLPGIEPIGDVLSARPDTTIGVAGYSFLPPSQAAAGTEIDAAITGFSDFLVSAYGIDPGQISSIAVGTAVFVPTPTDANHVWLQVGPASQGAFDVAAINPADIGFLPGSADLDVAGSTVVAALADILTTGGATIVVDVRAYEAGDDAANLALSEARRDTITEALVGAGVAPAQLRMYASGASSYLLGDGGPAITITVAP